MPNKEENIDLFVKKVITHYDVQYDEAHWESLEKRLDEDMPIVAKPVNTGVTTIVLSVLSGMVIMLCILWFSGVLDPKDTVSISQGKEVTAQTASRESKMDENVASNESVKTAQSSVNSSRNQRSAPTQVISNNDGESGNKVNTFNNPSNNQLPVAINSNDVRKEHDHYLIEKKSFSYPIQQVGYSLKESASYATVSNESEIPPVPQSGKDPIKLGVALSGAPDFNGVGMQSNKEASWQLGLQLFTTYKERISLSTGVLYNKKQYTTNGEYYYPPTGYWNRHTNGVVPDEVFGHCAVLDVPINLTYHWNPGKRIQFLSSVGVSNYFILGEDYHYRFFNGNPVAAEGWDTEEMTKQMFGVGNVSIGILWYIKPRVGIKLEPYLKIPLKEIGWGRVELYSTGTLLSIQYIFNKN